MGGALSNCEHVLHDSDDEDSDDEDECEGKLNWKAPSLEISKRVRTPVAKRAFAAGECVEKAYCLRLKRKDFRLSALNAYLYPVPDDPEGAKLFPLGWGLLYSHSTSDANLIADYVREVPQPAPQRKGSQPMSFKPEPRDFLVFTAAVDIEEGDKLFVAPPEVDLKNDYLRKQHEVRCKGCDEGLSVVDMMSRKLKIQEMEVDEEYVDTEVEGSVFTIGYLEEDDNPLVLGASPMHGLGVFAARDISEGEVITTVPQVPVSAATVDRTILRDYVFAQGDFKDEDFEYMQLGVGPIFNHSTKPNIEHRKHEASRFQPFLVEWVATKFIPEGEELCHDYGEEYWEGRPELVEKKAT